MELNQKYAAQINEFVTVCSTLARDCYVTSSGGNLAWKLEDNLLLITPTQMCKGDITPKDVLFIDLQGKIIAGKGSPTGETPMYLKLFNNRSDIVSIIHCHPPYLSAFAISNEKNWLMRPLFPETTIEIGPVPIVPYGEPLTETLANNFVPFLAKYNNFIMENHGMLSMTRGSIKHTLTQVQILEMSAMSIMIALQAGNLKELDRKAVKDLSHTMQTRGLPLVGAPGVNTSLEELYFTD